MIVSAVVLAFTLGAQTKVCYPNPGEGVGAAAQLSLLRSMPVRTIIKIAAGGRPDANGNVGHNRDTPGLWLGGEYQRSVNTFLVASILTNDLVGMESGWTGVAQAYAHQTGDGDFDRHLADGSDVTLLKDRASDTVFWLAYYCQAILLIQQSQFDSTFAARIASYHGNVRAAADFIATSDAQAALMGRDYSTLNRIILDGLAYQMAGQYLADASLRAIGDSFIAYAMEHQDSAGWYTEKNGWDSSYNGTSAWWMQIYNLYSPLAAQEASFTSSMAWEFSRVASSGEIITTGNTRTGGQEVYMGKTKDVNYDEVSMSLMYFSLKYATPAIFQSAMNVCAYKYGTKYCHY